MRRRIRKLRDDSPKRTVENHHFVLDCADSNAKARKASEIVAWLNRRNSFQPLLL